MPAADPAPATATDMHPPTAAVARADVRGCPPARAARRRPPVKRPYRRSARQRTRLLAGTKANNLSTTPSGTSLTAVNGTVAADHTS